MVAVLVLTLAALVATGAPVASAGVAACTPTGFVRDTINLTARMINPPGTVSGTVDATGCNIGVYYGPGHTGTVSHADVFGANYFGIVNDGGTVGINHSSVHDIGETPLNGTQHGNAIYFAVDDPGAAGSITHNHVWNYQKNGITDTSAGHRVAINHNVVNGEGPVDYIAQNGIEVGFGATATVTHNTVTGNSYTGAGGASSGGILVVGGACFSRPASVGVRINHNTLRGNDVGVFLANLDSTCAASVATPTRNVVSHNTIKNFAVNNTTGNGNGRATRPACPLRATSTRSTTTASADSGTSRWRARRRSCSASTRRSQSTHGCRTTTAAEPSRPNLDVHPRRSRGAGRGARRGWASPPASWLATSRRRPPRRCRRRRAPPAWR